MNNDTPADAITVIQADRDAAAERLSSPFDGSPIEATQDMIRAGKRDAHPWVQAFARHRTTSLAAQDGLVEALRQIAALNDLEDAPHDAIEAYARNALYECELIARAALASIEVKSS